MTFFPVRKEITRGAISIFAGVAVWEILARALLENELLIPPPSSVASTFWLLLTSGELNRHFATTATEFIYGFSAACLVGVVLGYLMACTNGSMRYGPMDGGALLDPGHRVGANDYHLVRYRHFLKDRCRV
jgi:ABC-type nitrate/sulfonate/bicarbonate transport system permease component